MAHSLNPEDLDNLKENASELREHIDTLCHSIEQAEKPEDIDTEATLNLANLHLDAISHFFEVHNLFQTSENSGQQYTLRIRFEDRTWRDECYGGNEGEDCINTVRVRAKELEGLGATCTVLKKHGNDMIEV